MKILVTGATGLIGSNLRAALLNRGHEVVGVARRPPTDTGGQWVALDLGQASTEDWRRCLVGVDAVVNCVGILRESGSQRFQDLHYRGPARLFDACLASGVRRVVQVSALGADQMAQTEYHRSKRAADEHLLGLPLNAVIVQPSLVFAVDGASSRALLTLASLPVVPLPAGGHQGLQPIALADLVAALLSLLTDEAAARRFNHQRIAMVGPRPLTLATYLAALRQGMGLGRGLTVAIPAFLMQIGARIGDTLGRWLPGLLLDSDSWQMLQRGNVADAGAVTSLLGRSPREADQFIAPARADEVRSSASMGWLQPLARLSLALVWIVTAYVSAFVYPVADSYELLARTGVPEAWRPAALYGAALLDLLLGLATLVPPHGQRWRQWLYPLQGGLILVYTALISWRMPEFWSHPYGPLLKNLPMLALIAWLHCLEPKRRA
ncbi:MAG TPA: SDR family oxidoreductase [Rubrivivax sp.]|nr:SDR family oxidoreductase [Rubrivivax sp.]